MAIFSQGHSGKDVTIISDAGIVRSMPGDIQGGRQISDAGIRPGASNKRRESADDGHAVRLQHFAASALRTAGSLRMVRFFLLNNRELHTAQQRLVNDSSSAQRGERIRSTIALPVRSTSLRGTVRP